MLDYYYEYFFTTVIFYLENAFVPFRENNGDIAIMFSY